MMKKLLFLAILAFTLGFSARAQVRIMVEMPGGGTREIAVESKPATDGSWGFGNVDTMQIRRGPAQCVLLPDDSLACSAITADLTGKIAIVHRGSPPTAPGCQFGCKAQNAQAAGAIACIIINNVGGGITMAGANCGINVTIPTVMISLSDGAALKSMLCAGPTVNIGTYRNVFANNIGIDLASGAVSPPAAAMPVGFINDTAMFRFFPSIFVDNNGSADQQNVKATAVVQLIYSPSQPYPQTIYADSTTIPLIQRADQPRDTAEVFFQEFDLFNVMQGDRQGIYELTYRIESPSGDELPSDNVIRYQFRVTDRYFSLAPLNPANDDLARFAAISPAVNNLAPTNRVFKFGPVMQTPRLQSGQLLLMDSVRLAVTAGDTVDFTALQINIEVHKWLDANNDGAIAETELSQIGNGLMAFQDISEKGKFMTIGIDDAVTGNPGPIALESNTAYVILAAYRGDDMVAFSSEDEQFPYDRYFNTQAQRVINPVFVNQWFSGFTGENVAAFRVGLLGVVASKPSTNQIAVSLFPNPAREYVQVQMDERLIAEAQLEVRDMSGRLLKVATTRSANGIRVNTRGLETGVYQMTVRSLKGVAVKKFTVTH